MSINLQESKNFLDFDVTYIISVFAENRYGRSEGSEAVPFTRSSSSKCIRYS